MNPLTTTLLVGSGGFIGAVSRYWIGLGMQSRLGDRFPWHTLAINIAGSLLIGLFLALSIKQGWHENWRAFVAVGILGGFTTFSAFSYEAFRLFGKGEVAGAVGYSLGSVIACILATWIGILIADLLT